MVESKPHSSDICIALTFLRYTELAALTFQKRAGNIRCRQPELAVRQGQVPASGAPGKQTEPTEVESRVIGRPSCAVQSSGERARTVHSVLMAKIQSRRGSVAVAVRVEPSQARKFVSLLLYKTHGASRAAFWTCRRRMHSRDVLYSSCQPASATSEERSDRSASSKVIRSPRCAVLESGLARYVSILPSRL